MWLWNKQNKKKKEAPKSSKPSQTSDNQLVENVDFYIENGFYVFTETYHKKRGYCCNSGCRHCPYDNE